jgi:hypothetical protein
MLKRIITMATISKSPVLETHQASVRLLSKTLQESLLKSVDTEAFSQLFDQKNLSEEGKQTFGTGLNIDALTNLQEQLKKDFNNDYQDTIDLGQQELQSNELKITVKNAQARLAEKLKTTKAKLLEKLTAELNSNGQVFNAEDQAQLNNAFNQYMDKTAEKLNESLKQFESLNRIKLRLQTHNAINSTDATFRAMGLNNTHSLSDIPKPSAPMPGFTVNSNKLYSQLKYTLANKKSGERINIELTVPNREENQRQIAEAGLQYRTPGLALLLSMLLLLFVHLRLVLKNDEQKVTDAINKLIKGDGLSIDPNDIKLKISQIGHNGKDYVIHEGDLSEPSLKQLNRSSQEIKKILHEGYNSSEKNKIPSLSPDSGYNSPAEESDNDEASKQNSISPVFHSV